MAFTDAETAEQLDLQRRQTTALEQINKSAKFISQLLVLFLVLGFLALLVGAAA